MSLPYFKEFGWQATVLTVKPEYVEGERDQALLQSVHASTGVIRTKALPANRTRQIGLGSLGLRALPFLRTGGDGLLRKKEVDLVYFSTTIFPVMALGPYWHKRWQVPYIIDFQDPWLSDYYDSTNGSTPPGGRVKYGMSRSLARLLEPRVMRRVAQVVSVSPAYPQTLLARYSWLRAEQFTVLPFGADDKDFENTSTLKIKQGIFDPNDGNRHWVYVGRGGRDMAKALRILFLAIRQEREHGPERFRSLKLHFVGTDYAPAGRELKTIEPIARECGVIDLIDEQTARVPYFEALKILLDADAILLLGSDDPSYTASKLYPCILSRKPILAVFHERSSVVDILGRCNAGRTVTFTMNNSIEDVLGDARQKLDWLLSLPKGYSPDTDWSEFEPYTAREMTRRQCEVFDRCMAKQASL